MDISFPGVWWIPSLQLLLYPLRTDGLGVEVEEG